MVIIVNLMDGVKLRIEHTSVAALRAEVEAAGEYYSYTEVDGGTVGEFKTANVIAMFAETPHA